DLRDSLARRGGDTGLATWDSLTLAPCTLAIAASDFLAAGPAPAGMVSGLELVEPPGLGAPPHRWYVEDAASRHRVREMPERWGVVPLDPGDYSNIVGTGRGAGVAGERGNGWNRPSQERSDPAIPPG